MTGPLANPSYGGSAVSGSFRDTLRNAVRFWEPRRVAYNLALGALVAGWVVVTWPHFRTALTRETWPPLIALVALANVAYSAAYLVDLPLQQSEFREGWRRRRWWLWLAGTMFALLLAQYWIGDEIYPFVR